MVALYNVKWNNYIEFRIVICGKQAWSQSDFANFCNKCHDNIMHKIWLEKGRVDPGISDLIKSGRVTPIVQFIH